MGVIGVIGVIMYFGDNRGVIGVTKGVGVTGRDRDYKGCLV